LPWLKKRESQQDVEHGWLQSDSTVGATHEIRLSVSQIAALDKAEFLILF
jgi:hypothetical protein